MARSKRTPTELNLEPTANDPRLFEINEQLDEINAERQRAVNLHAELLNELRPENAARTGPSTGAPVEVGTMTATVLQTSLKAEIANAQRAIDSADEALAVIEKRRGAILEQVQRDRAEQMGPAFAQRAEAVTNALADMFRANAELERFKSQLDAASIPFVGPLANLAGLQQCHDVAAIFKLPAHPDMQYTVEQSYWSHIVRAFPSTPVAKIAENRLREINKG